MSERIPAQIKIGGEIPADVFLGLAAAFDCEGVSFEWGDSSMTFRQVVEEALEGFPTGSGFLIGVDSEANYGNFPEIEEYCAKHGIDFDKHNDAKFEHDAMVEYFRSGKSIEVNTTQGGDELVNLDPLRELVAKWRKQGRRILMTSTAARILARVLPAEVSPLPPLAVVGDLEKALIEREARDE